jgi:hypothetical protein
VRGRGTHGQPAWTWRCQVGSGTDSPCARPATAEILGVLFCEQHAREQEAYFAIGESTRAPRDGVTRRTSRVVAPATLARPSQRLRRTAIGKALGLLMAVAALVLAAAACGGAQQPLGDSAAAEEPAVARTPEPHERERVAELDGAVARAGDVMARADGGAVARAGDVVASTRDAVASREDDAGEGGPRKVKLKVAGDPGTAFSGLCSAGGRKDAIEGRAPARYSYELGDGKLVCDIRKEGGGVLETVVTGEGVHSLQRSVARGSTIRFAISEDDVTSSTLSVSTNQTIESSNRSFARIVDHQTHAKRGGEQ